jgi:site-specific DNA-cytosine methylase
VIANGRKPLRFLSVCSGIEAASQALHRHGFECAAVSEIEPHPCAVLAAAQAQIEALRGAAGNAAMYLEGGFINCPRCGEEVPTKHTDAEHELRSALAARPAKEGE